MKKQPKLSKAERLEIDHLVNTKSYSLRETARLLERSPSTISRELRRNYQKKANIYVGNKAHHKARVRKKYARLHWKKIDENKKLQVYIIKGLKRHWGPDEISGRMREEKKPFYVSKTAIYEWLRSPYGYRYCPYLYSRRYFRKKRVKKTRRVMITNRIGIEKRPVSATNRTRYGHTEIDTIVSGKQGRGAISVLCERKSRYLDARRLSTLKSSEHTKAVNDMLEARNARSATCDNGVENQHHQNWLVPTYFCDPYSSWQRGSVENANKMIRRYLPKGTNLSQVTKETLDSILAMINAKPRKILGYQTAYEVAVRNGYISGKNTRSERKKQHVNVAIEG